MSERESMSFDVVIVGGGAAGLSAAIRLRQLALETERELSVVVLEKASEVGGHSLSGAVIDPVGLDRLLPAWKQQGAPLTTPVQVEHLSYLTRRNRIDIPAPLLPPSMRHRGCYIGSLGALTRWLGERAAELGVEIYPGFAAAETLHDEKGRVTGVATPDQGRDKNGEPTSAFQPGMALLGRYTLIAEGSRGALAERLIARYRLGQGRDVEKYALGVKELWRVQPEKHRHGWAEHMLGWPLRGGTLGGGFLYHYGENLVSVGLSVHLDYRQPSLSPFELMQRLKTHPSVSLQLRGGERIGFGARSLTIGGWQSRPNPVFPGGLLLGCSAGLLNFARLKGVHMAMLSGQLAAEVAFAAIAAGRSHDELSDYEATLAQARLGAELYEARNLKPLMERAGALVGGTVGMVDQWSQTLLTLGLPTLAHKGRDRDSLVRTSSTRLEPSFRPDGRLTFDRESSVYLAGVHHDEDQPGHLILKRPQQVLDNWWRFGVEPAEFYCPAHVYELRHEAEESGSLRIAAGNCLHCKACDIKDPADNIRWVLPASGGPRYVDL